jgi:hypothetical protein
VALLHAPHGFYSKVYSKGLMKYYNLGTMNASSEYKVELANSIQKCILRVYIMKYSDLGTMNASREYKQVEHGHGK